VTAGIAVDGLNYADLRKPLSSRGLFGGGNIVDVVIADKAVGLFGGGRCWRRSRCAQWRSG